MTVLFSFTMFKSSGPLTEIKLIPVSLAMALASKVFPHPGGPHNNIPLAAVKPNALNCSECLIGACNKKRCKFKLKKYTNV